MDGIGWVDKFLVCLCELCVGVCGDNVSFRWVLKQGHFFEELCCPVWVWNLC